MSEVPDVPDPAPGLDDLPPRVRERVVARVAGILPEVPELPGPLTRVATFTPARRARLGGAAIADALRDDGFRAACGIQSAGAAPGSVGQLPGPDERAAAAWLERSEGWSDRLVESLADLVDQAGRDEDAAADSARAEADRLRDRLDALHASLREQRATHRAELDTLRSETRMLRQRLGDARREAREALAAREAAEARAGETVGLADQGLVQAEAEVRRMRAELEQARAGRATERREGRAERDGATLRARYLLDTVLDAAAGLRRELALPPATAPPGEALERDLMTAADGAGRRTSSPVVLEHLLAMPRVRLIVDGYNVSKQTWPSLTLEVQRSRLVAAMGPLVARTGAETTVVFDAGAVGATRSPAPTPRGVRVVFSPPGVIADDVVRQLVDAEPRGRVVVVVTSDAELARGVSGAGAQVVPSATFAGYLAG